MYIHIPTELTCTYINIVPKTEATCILYVQEPQHTHVHVHVHCTLYMIPNHDMAIIMCMYISAQLGLWVWPGLRTGVSWWGWPEPSRTCQGTGTPLCREEIWTSRQHVALVLYQSQLTWTRNCMRERSIVIVRDRSNHVVPTTERATFPGIHVHVQDNETDLINRQINLPVYCTCI